MNIIFLTEPPTIRATNKLLNVPGDIYCAKDIIVCQTKINDRLTYLVSLYLDSKKLEFPPEFIKLIRNKGKSDILIASDSNAHSTVWNCPRTDRRGEFVEDFLISNNLQCVNVGNIPTFRNGSGHTSILDIMVANYRLATSIFNWKVDNDLHISDQYRISFSINNSSNFRVADVSDWNYRKGDWGLFKRELDCGLLKWSNARYWTATSIEEKLSKFLSILNTTLTKTIPKKSVQA